MKKWSFHKKISYCFSNMKRSNLRPHFTLLGNCLRGINQLSTLSQIISALKLLQKVKNRCSQELESKLDFCLLFGVCHFLWHICFWSNPAINVKKCLACRAVAKFLVGLKYWNLLKCPAKKSPTICSKKFLVGWKRWNLPNCLPNKSTTKPWYVGAYVGHFACNFCTMLHTISFMAK